MCAPVPAASMMDPCCDGLNHVLRPSLSLIGVPAHYFVTVTKKLMWMHSEVHLLMSCITRCVFSKSSVFIDMRVSISLYPVKAWIYFHTLYQREETAQKETD